MGKTAFIFPGQGAQYVGMARDFYDAFPECRDAVDQAADLLDFNLRGILFDENELIHKTEYTQAAMLVAEVCILRGVTLTGKTMDVTAGLSLGEYSALVACGAMDYADAVRVVRKRGIYMENAVPAGKGGMSAIIGLPNDKVEEICRSVSEKTGLCCVPANYNCPGQIVISGNREAVEYAGERFKEAGAKLVAPLKVSGPFHSPLLTGAGEKLAQALAEVSFRDPEKPYVANVNAELITDRGNIRRLLTEQVSSPVRWEQSVRKMIEYGVTDFVEIGPGKTLAGFMKRIDRGMAVATINGVADLDKLNAASGEEYVGSKESANA